MEIRLNKQPRISWYPGHMLKAERELKETLSLIDFVIEVVDARAPESTKNHRLTSIIKAKPRVLILNKCDLADPTTSENWANSFKKRNVLCFSSDKSSNNSLKKLVSAIKKIIHGRLPSAPIGKPPYRPIRAIVIGMPNVGKSTLINRITGQKKAYVGILPGVTRHQQWIKLSNEIELLDTPGVATPRIDTVEIGLKFCLLAIIKEKLIETETVVEYLFTMLQAKNKTEILTAFDMQAWPTTVAQLLETIGRHRKLVKGGGIIDLSRAATCFIHDFRKGKFGRISLEKPEDKESKADR